jgi:predicted nucleotidyltransferase component of viral defense system
MGDSIYHKQAELLLRILPSVMREDVFALKGGTAINFFWRDYPRLSVDIDLAYIKIQDRDSTLKDINDRLLKVDERIKRIYPGAYIQQKKENKLTHALIVRAKDVTVKIEANFNLRGSVFESVNKKLSTKAEKEFALSVSARTLSFEDLYGGKICAALDRQHPRDLFDIKLLLENEGLTDKIREAFIVYLISHGRPMVELLNPGLLDIAQVYKNEFVDMPTEPVELDDLLNARTELIKQIKGSLTADEITFILSVKNKQPQWELLGLAGIEDLPGVKYKLMNLERMDPEKHMKAYEKLERYFTNKN